jgi:class 3 adenylate cyclase
LTWVKRRALRSCILSGAVSPAPVKRKLAAILAADAVGYSRMMAADEEGTMKILSAHRAVIDGIIEFHEGRIVNTAGDSVLAEFSSPIEAVRCAVEIQEALKTRNDSLPEAQRMQFRIGVNLGDVMVKGSDLLGDGVNVAARLQSIAEPGNIYLSSSVYDQIAGKLDLGFADLGDQALKNIDRPIHAYRIEREGRRAVPARPSRKGIPAAAWVGALLGAMAIALALAWVVGLPGAPQPAPRPVAVAPAPAPEPRPAEAEAALAKARAEAEEAKRRAESEAAAAAEAKRALEEQRAAEARARAQAELARARAETEAARRRLQEELAAAEKAQRAAEAAPVAAKPPDKIAAAPPPPAAAPTAAGRYQGSWMAVFDCPPFRDRPAANFAVPFSVSGDLFELQFREHGQPGSFSLRGAPRPDGGLQLSGTVFSAQKDSFGRPFPAGFDTKLEGERFAGSGRLGGRSCSVSLARR